MGNPIADPILAAIAAKAQTVAQQQGLGGASFTQQALGQTAEQIVAQNQARAQAAAAQQAAGLATQVKPVGQNPAPAPQAPQTITDDIGPGSGWLYGPDGRPMAAPITTAKGVYQPAGSVGYQSGFNRLDTSGAERQINAAGASLLQQGLDGTTLAGMPMASATPVTARTMQGAQIDRTGFNRATVQQDQLANRGNAAISGLEQAAAGQVPSVAAIQQQQGIEQAQRAAMAVAASARGGADARAATMRAGAAQASGIAQAGVAQAAQLRAAEMAQARGQLVGAVGQQQGLAQQQGALAAGLATDQAGLVQQQNLVNAGAQNQALLANQAARLQAQGLNQSGYLQARSQDAAAIGAGIGGIGAAAGLGVGTAAYNNDQYGRDVDIQMRMAEQRLAKYGVDQGVSVQREVADTQADAAMMGAALNAAGQIGGASINYFGQPQQR